MISLKNKKANPATQELRNSGTQELKTKHFQQPETLCDFVNSGGIQIVTICPYDRFQVVYYYEIMTAEGE